MSFVVEHRASDAPCVESVMHGRTVGDGLTIRPAESHWHLVVTRYHGQTRALVVGPLTAAGQLAYGGDAEILWIKFRLGAFMPHLPLTRLRDTETELPGATGQKFWLKSSTWQLPDFENADTFVSRLMREGVLTWDPLISAALQHQAVGISPRTVRHRFLQATGLSQNQIYQLSRAQRAEQLLRQGVSILDTVAEAGYADQPHLTRALRQWIGFTPAELQRTLTAR